MAGAVIALTVAMASADYVVQPGDTLTSIARKHGTTVSQLAAANSLRNPDLIRVGQRLVIPGTDQGTGQGAPGPSSATHTVQPGETLESIARRYGVSLATLAAANGIVDPSVIYAGTRLRLSGPAFVAGAGGTSAGAHVVAAGETLSSIAARYGSTVSELATLNGISNPNRIYVGTRLTVPGGGWICPVPGARYFNDWGFPRSGGRFHEGNDLFAPRGTPVLAPVSGVVHAETGTIGGLQFRLLGDDGTTYIGSHLDAFGATGRVTAGTVIGYVGDSGNARGAPPMLHFEIHPAGSGPVNPYPTLKAHGC